MFCNNEGTRPSSPFFFFSLVSQILTGLRAYHKNFSQLNILERRYSHCRVNLNISSAIVHGRYRTRNVKSICVSTLLLSFLFLPSFFLLHVACHIATGARFITIGDYNGHLSETWLTYLSTNITLSECHL